MTVYIFKGETENGATEFRFLNKAMNSEMAIYAKTEAEAKKEYRKTFDLIGKSVKWADPMR